MMAPGVAIALLGLVARHPAVEEIAKGIGVAIDVVGVGDGPKRRCLELLPRIAGDAAESVVDLEPAALHVDEGHTDRRTVEGAREVRRRDKPRRLLPLVLLGLGSLTALLGREPASAVLRIAHQQSEGRLTARASYQSILLILAATSSPSPGLSHEFRSSGALGTDDLTAACPESGLATLVWNLRGGQFELSGATQEVRGRGSTGSEQKLGIFPRENQTSYRGSKVIPLGLPNGRNPKPPSAS
jgi:hypothetical protein